MAQTKPKAGQFYGVSDNGTDGQFLKTDGTGGMSWDSPITNPTITSIDYPGSATAADPAGGESVIINGTLFASGITCTIGGTSAVTAFNSATQITITTPAKAAGQYTVAVTHPNGGTASEVNFIQYSGVPVWSTASGNIGSVQSGSTASFQVTATEGSDTIEYAVTTGTLPTGLSLATATGAITGTAGSVSASTTTTFSITATDDENQTSSARSFNITVTPDLPSNHFNTVLYTGTDASHAITGVGFKPDLVWIKRRSSSESHALYDSIRGINKQLSSNSSGAQATNTSPYEGFTSFDTDGFTVDNNGATNRAPNTYVAWNFKGGGTPTATNAAAAGSVPTLGSVMVDGTASTSALAGTLPILKISANTTLGFSIIQYNGGTGTLPHELGVTPKLIIQKNQAGTNPWYTYVPPGVIDSNYNYLELNTAAAMGQTGSTAPTSTTFNPVSNGGPYIAYCFTSKPGFSKVGTYTGTGASGNLVQTGFEPAFVIIKAVNSGDNWYMLDNKRLNGGFPYTNVLYPNLANSEQANVGGNGEYSMNFLTNGFELTEITAGYNQNNGTFLYIAFAADPSTTTPSLANSFNTTLYSGSSSTPLNVNGVGFKADFSWLKVRNNSWSNGLFSSVMPFGVNGGVKNLYSNNQNAASDLWGTLTWNNNGWTLNGGSYNGSSAHDFGAAPYNYVSWNWKGGGLASINTDGTIDSLVSANQAAGFSVIRWTGNGTTGATIGHGLNAAPELFITKNIEATNLNWATYNVTTGNSARLTLNENAAVNNGRVEWNSTTPTSSVVTFSDHPCVNSSGVSYIGYAFTSISGYSKVGTYTGLGSGGPLTVNMGFAPTLALIKRTDSTGGWRMFDTVRGTDKSLRANSADAEYDDTSNYMDFTSTGFYFSTSQANADINTAGGTYIYLAIKEN